MNNATHFGFQQVPEGEKSARVREVFKSVAPSYDVMNDLMSGGMHRLWKRFTVDLANVKPGEKILDVASGSADLALAPPSGIHPSPRRPHRSRRAGDDPPNQIGTGRVGRGLMPAAMILFQASEMPKTLTEPATSTGNGRGRVPQPTKMPA